ncbi:GGDEF domain-containing protein [Chitinibacter tainanensis]|uniref:GGDEF domain-containing protein n=1 Tax=Chitinibacter tainanensis TaxID=230667 RepID=UPI00041D3115|nr:GGDEF domain-containing protein [Chitinibacter tainanensis]
MPHSQTAPVDGRLADRLNLDLRQQRQRLMLSLLCLALLAMLLQAASGYPLWLALSLPALAALSLGRTAWALQQADSGWEPRADWLAVGWLPLLATLAVLASPRPWLPTELVLPFMLQPQLLLMSGLRFRPYALAVLSNLGLATLLIVLAPASTLNQLLGLLCVALATALGLNSLHRRQSQQRWLRNMRQHVVETSEKMAERQQKMRKLAFEDPLTGLANRLELINQLRRSLKNPLEDARHCVVYLIDLDFFKTVNDEYGHAAGDALLTEVAQRFRGLVRRGDLVCRLGGDEFVIVVRGVSRAAEQGLIADKILAALAEPVLYQGQRLPLGGSIGVAPWFPHLRSPASWLACADAVMYQAKTGGRNRYVIADPDTPYQVESDKGAE